MSGRQLSFPPRSPEQAEIVDALNGGLGQQNIAVRGVALPASAYNPAQRGSDPVRDGFASLDAQLVEFLIPVTVAAATADTSVHHGLGRIPAGFLVVSIDQQGIVVAGSPTGKAGGNRANSTPWSKNEITLRAHSTLAAPATPVRVRILVF